MHGMPISEGAFDAGRPQGPWVYYDDAGVKMREQTYDHGALTGGIVTIYTAQATGYLECSVAKPP